MSTTNLLRHDKLTARLQQYWPDASVEQALDSSLRPVPRGPWYISGVPRRDLNEVLQQLGLPVDTRISASDRLVPAGSGQHEVDRVVKLLTDPEPHIFAFPIHNLELSDAVGQELRIEGTTFVSAHKLRLDAQRLLGRDAAHFEGMLARQQEGDPFSWAPTFALVRSRRHRRDSHEDLLARLDDACTLLAASEFGLPGARDSRALFGGPHHQSEVWDRYVVVRRGGDSVSIPSTNLGPLDSFHLDERWARNLAAGFFGPFLEILDGRRPVDAPWRSALRRAVLLAGRSYGASTLRDAFLPVIAAWEVLLTRKGESIRRALQWRIVGLLGHDVVVEEGQRLSAVVDRLYDIRCDLVHDGDDDQLSMLDLAYADTILHMLFYNLCHESTTFSSKQAVADFWDSGSALQCRLPWPAALDHPKHRLLLRDRRRLNKQR